MSPCFYIGSNLKHSNTRILKDSCETMKNDSNLPAKAGELSKVQESLNVVAG